VSKWGFTPVKSGSWIVCRSVEASNFGGPGDGEDNGEGAWGFPVRQYADLLGCALPVRDPGIKSLADSPIPMLPHMTLVHVYSHTTGKTCWCSLVDKGPSGGLNRAIDLTDGACRALGLPIDGLYTVDIRIFAPGVALP
jgi:hypothetical protein